MTFLEWTDLLPCPSCDGRGWIIAGSREPIRPCPACKAAGRVLAREEVPSHA